MNKAMLARLERIGGDRRLAIVLATLPGEMDEHEGGEVQLLMTAEQWERKHCATGGADDE